MKSRPITAVFSAWLSLALASLACAGGSAAPTRVPTRVAPTSAPPTQAAATQPEPTVAATTAATTAATEAAQSTATQSATTAATAGPTTAATKAPLSGSLDVHGVSSYLDGTQYFHVVGLVTNGTDKPVNNIVLNVQLTDANGKTVLQDNSGHPTSTVSIDTMLSTLASGESTPFDYDQSANGADTTGWKFKVAAASSDNPTDLQRAKVEVANPQTTVHSDGEVYLTGELVNQGDQPAHINTLAAALLDASGNVAGASGFSAVSRLLAPAGAPADSDRTPFKLNISGPVAKGATPAFYVDSVLGSASDISTASDVHLNLATGFVDANNDVHVVANVTNSGTTTMTVEVVAGLYDQAGNVIDADSTSAPIDLPPGATSPVPFYYFTNVNGNAAQINKVVSETAQIDPFWTFPTTMGLVSLAASKVVTTTSAGTFTIKGDAVNTSTQTLDNVTVVLALHDASGKLVAADSTKVSPDNGALPPKAKLSWSIDTPLPDKVDGTTLKFDLIVQGQVK